MPKRQIAIVTRECSYTVQEWVCHWVWQYLIGKINVIELQVRLDKIDPEMPGALDPWPEVDTYFRNLGKQHA